MFLILWHGDKFYFQIFKVLPRLRRIFILKPQLKRRKTLTKRNRTEEQIMVQYFGFLPNNDDQSK